MERWNNKKIVRRYILWMWLCYSTAFPLVAISKEISATVPFENIILEPNDFVQASYAFGNHPIIFCFENNQETIGSIQWPLQGQMQDSTLPIFLKTNGQFEGKFADASGTIRIANTANHTLIVNCPFGF